MLALRGTKRTFRVSLHTGGTEGNMTKLTEEDAASGTSQDRFLNAIADPGTRLRSLARFAGQLDLSELDISSSKTGISARELRRVVSAALVEAFGRRVIGETKGRQPRERINTR